MAAKTNEIERVERIAVGGWMAPWLALAKTIPTQRLVGRYAWLHSPCERSLLLSRLLFLFTLLFLQNDSSAVLFFIIIPVAFLSFLFLFLLVLFFNLSLFLFYSFSFFISFLIFNLLCLYLFAFILAVFAFFLFNLNYLLRFQSLIFFMHLSYYFFSVYFF